MSPEQARGLSVDKRTDIWAFGCVLYEMLSGHALFAGERASDILAKIIEREPDLAALPTATPAPENLAPTEPPGDGANPTPSDPVGQPDSGATPAPEPAPPDPSPTPMVEPAPADPGTTPGAEPAPDADPAPTAEAAP